MSETTALDDEDLAILEHALGLDQQDEPYRRYYVAPLCTSWFDQCERLTEIGLMVPFGEPDGCGQTFHVTHAGAAQIGVQLP
jgi:hypothetical protein